MTTTELFVRLGRRLGSIGEDDAAVVAACRANGWFTAAEVCRALRAVAEDMLDRERLERWLAAYPSLPAGRQRNVLVIMAGNIPAVGFFDLLCVCMSGHRCIVKPSSKDRVTMDFIISTMREIDPHAPVEYYDSQRIDAVIATGSDNANRYFRARYGGIPSLLRGSRSSVAVLAGDESEDELRGLSDDIFAYSGLGCRNVSVVFAPRGYELRIPVPDRINRKYTNNYIQTKAIAEMRGEEFSDTGCAIVAVGDGFPAELSRINCIRYDSMAEVDEWLAAHDGELQCVVSRCCDHPRSAGFGCAQRPSLTDYPDAADVMEFLSSLDSHDAAEGFRNIAIVGSGNLAEALAAAVARLDGIRLTVAARNALRGRAIAERCGARYVAADAALHDIDLCIIAVSDTAIAGVAEALDLAPTATVAHTSGSTPFDALPARYASRGAFYPFQTFTAGREVDFAQIPIFIEGSDPQTAEALHAVACRLSRNVAPADTPTRRMIHLAGVFACNFANRMFGIGGEIVSRAGLSFDTLRPLIAETAAKALAAASPAEVQTGPAVRGDAATQQRHAGMLAGKPQLAEIYKLVSENIWQTSKKR